MSKSFSHLIWLGAGEAKEPSNLIAQANRVILVDARETACEYLRRQFPSDRVLVVQQLLTVSGGQQSFTEYSLKEYSALQPATGLKSIFPGLKVTSQETVDSISIKQFFKDLTLTDNNNVLIIDLPDINLPFLKALQETGEFYKFSKIYIVANPESLYLDAIDVSGVEAFFQSVGYLREETFSADPDFPCLVFGLNPQWIELQQANKLNANLAKEAKELQSQQVALNQQLTEVKQQVDVALSEKTSLWQQLDLITKELGALKQQEHQIAKERDTLKQELMQQQKEKEATGKALQSQNQQLVELKQKLDQLTKERDVLKQQLVQQQQAKETLDKELQLHKQQLVEASQRSDQILKERDTFKQQLLGAKQVADAVEKDRDSIKQQLASQQQQNNEQNKEQEKLKQKLTEEQKKLTEVNGLLEQATKQSASRKDTVGKLEKDKRELEEANKSLKLKQDLLEKELIKAEAQIDLIKILLVKV